MAIVYLPPDTIRVPQWEDYETDGKFSITKMNELDDKYRADCAAWIKKAGYRHRLSGEVIRFPVGDGYAEYMIVDGQHIMHLPLGDCWQIPEAYARGLRAGDLTEMVRRRKAVAALFAKQATP